MSCMSCSLKINTQDLVSFLYQYTTKRWLSMPQAPIALGKDGGHCPTPPLLLRSVRDALGALGAKRAKPGRRAVIFITRKKGDMRSSLQGQSELEKELRGWALTRSEISRDITPF